MKSERVKQEMEITFIDGAVPDRSDTVRALFREYEQWLGVSLCFQGFDKELAELPGAYAPPRGRLYIIEKEGDVAGCIALRPMKENNACEMKRLYLRDNFRGQGLGRAMAERIITDARSIGYSLMKLDTLGQMTAARGLYRSLGFREVPAYYDNPLPNVVYMELAL